MAWSVYMHTCPNGKRYIGITSKKPEKRWSRGLGYHTQIFYRAIKKYGWDNIKHEIVDVVETVEEAVQLEAEYIKKYNTTSRWHGYNVSPSAIACGGLPQPRHSEATRKKMSESAKRRPPRVVTQAMLDHLKALREKMDYHAPKHLTKEGRIKNIRSKARVIIQYTSDMHPISVWESGQQVIETLGINPYPSLYDSKRKCGGFFWKCPSELPDSEVGTIFRSNIPVHLLTGETVKTLEAGGIV